MKKPPVTHSCEVTPEEMIEAMQKGPADLMEEIGIGRKARMQKLKTLLNNKHPSIVRDALTLACKLGGDFPAEKQANTVTGTLTISWEK